MHLTVEESLRFSSYLPRRHMDNMTSFGGGYLNQVILTRKQEQGAGNSHVPGHRSQVHQSSPGNAFGPFPSRIVTKIKCYKALGSII